MSMRMRDLRTFRSWLEDVCLTPEALELVRDLSWDEVRDIADYLTWGGIPLQDGRPTRDDDSLWELLEEALVEVLAERVSRWE